MRWPARIVIICTAALLPACGGSLPPSDVPTPAPTPAVTATPTAIPEPARSYLFVHESGGMTGYAIDANAGSLTQTTFLAGPDELVPQPGGDFAFWFHCRSTNRCAFHTYEITNAGELVDSERETETTAADGSSLVVASRDFLYSACEEWGGTFAGVGFCTFRIDRATGATGFQGEFGRRDRTFATDSNGIDAMALSAHADRLYAAEQNSVLVTYNIGANGFGSPEHNVHFPGIGRSIALDRSGRFLYLLSQGDTKGRLCAFALDDDGKPELMRIVDTAFGRPRSLTMDPKGRFVYATAEQGVEPFSIDGETGLLSAGRRLPSQDKPYAGLAVTPDGRFAYLARAGGVWGYVIDPENGGLSDLGRLAPGLGSMIIVAR